MTESMRKLLEVQSSASDFINILVENGVISVKELGSQALEYPEIIFKVSKCVKGVSIDDLATAIIHTKNARYIAAFATDIDDAPVKRLMFGMLVSNAPVLDKLIYLYGMKEKLQGNEETKKQFYNIVIDRFVDIIIAKGNPKDMEDLHRYAPTDEIKEKLRVVCDNIKLQTATNEERFKRLCELYQEGDFEAIRKERDTFRDLFVEKGEEIAR